MPRFPDMHTGVYGVTPEQPAEGHARDLAVQDEYGVRCIKYLYDAATGKFFCLSDAPSN
jgi:hypothetical protein